MLPIVYSSGTQNSEFTQHNGLGFAAKCLSCVVSETLNGEYELEAEIMTQDRLASSISTQNYIKVKPNPSDDMQVFEIYEVEKRRGKLLVKAEHIRYRMNGNAFTEPWYITDSGQAQTPSQIWEAIQDFLAETSEFTFTSDISTTAKPTAAANEPIRLGDFMLGKDGSMLDTFGGEYKFDNFTFSLNRRRGSDTGVCLRLGAGIQDVRYKIASDRMCTDVLPYARLQKVDSEGKVIGELTAYAEPVTTNNTILNSRRVFQHDFSQDFITRYPDFKIICDAQGIPINFAEARQKLVTLCQTYISRNYKALTQPLVTLDADIIAENEQLATCTLGDTIQVFVESMGIFVESKIVKTEYDVLRGRYKKIQVGDTPKGLSQYFTDANIGGA